MLKYEMKPIAIFPGIPDESSILKEYKSGYEEFRVFNLTFKNKGEKICLKFSCFSVAIVT